MKNPLMKRLPREFAADASKYIAIFVMLVLLIALCSGMQVGNESLKAAYYESFELYKLEDGHVSFSEQLSKEVREALEEKMEITLYENMYFEEDTRETGATIRVYKQTDELNLPCLLEGKLPEEKDGIAIDRVFAQNNDLSIGDILTLNGRELTVMGLVALPDYSTLYENNTDAMFDSINFSVAVMSEEGFEETKGKNFSYNYAWRYKDPCADDIEAAERSEEFLEILQKLPMDYGVLPEDYLPRYLNQAITFSIEDIGGDEAATMIVCYMMIAVIAFVFAVTISNTIVQEAGVIGTLRALGYTKGELIRHYMLLPVIVTLIAGLVGNVLGYTVFKDYCVELYRDSYSLTTYKTLWNSSAFILSTVVPIVLMLVINLTMLISRLKLSPLKFLRHDLKKNKNKKAMRLNTKIPFKTRFSLRIFFTNLSGYLVMIIGILFGAVLISFGDMLPRMLDTYREMIVQDMISDYQYVVYDYRSVGELSDEAAEKYASSSYDHSKEGFLTDSITVYGIEKDSQYIHAEMPEGKVLISTGISEKFGLKKGDILTLDEKYKKDVSYQLEIDGVYDYQSSMAVFMDIHDYDQTFDKEEDYFTGYFSDRELTELDEKNIATIITAEDYTKLSDQLTVSMGGIMGIIKWFGAAFFIIVVYILCKQVIERNFQSIALTKILGFRNGEIAGLYITATSIAVLIGLFVSVPFVDIVMREIFHGYLYTMMAGYLPYIMDPKTYAVTISTGLLCYVTVALLKMRKIARVPKSEALKNVE